MVKADAVKLKAKPFPMDTKIPKESQIKTRPKPRLDSPLENH
jgi:hypothetical protein